MSAYGRLHDQLRRVRDRIAALVPGADTSSYLRALEASASHQQKIERALAEWRRLEHEMSKTE